MSDFDKQNAVLNRHILGIKQLVSNPDLRGLTEETGLMGQRFIEMHNIEGRYLGGDYAAKGYSTTTLPLFFFGDATLVERTGNMRVNAPRFNLSNVLIKKEDIDWHTSRTGKKVAKLVGGYATWLRYTRPGKNLGKVDHTFTGGMLRNLTHEMIFQTNASEVRWYVRPPHDAKAAYTNAKREWMGLFREEIREIAKMAANKYGLIIVDNLSVK